MQSIIEAEESEVFTSAIQTKSLHDCFQSNRHSCVLCKVSPGRGGKEAGHELQEQIPDRSHLHCDNKHLR